MSLQVWLDGESVTDTEHALAVTNRGLHYGDGVFETMFLQQGTIRFRDAHLQRAEEGCHRLGIVPPTRAELLDDLQRLPHSEQPAIVKLLLVRAGAGRGYRPVSGAGAMRLMLLYPWTTPPSALRVQWCTTRWSCNPQLAGLKHLNRLEQVLAQRELREGFDEGLMLDTSGELISATSGNVFVIADGRLRTPDLRACGVHGVMRAQVIAAARFIGMAVEECALWPRDIGSIDEAFITNALRGMQPIVQLDERPMSPASGIAQLSRVLNL